MVIAKRTLWFSRMQILTIHMPVAIYPHGTILLVSLLFILGIFVFNSFMCLVFIQLNAIKNLVQGAKSGDHFFVYCKTASLAARPCTKQTIFSPLLIKFLGTGNKKTLDRVILMNRTARMKVGSIHSRSDCMY